MKKLHLASTLILVAHSTSQKFPKVLALQRSSQMKHLPKAFVFPGGYVDDADEHIDWLSIVPSSERDVSLNILRSEPLPSGEVPKAVSLRIAAIREAFEECGILLCRKTDRSDVISLSSADEDSWRKKIHKNASEFLNFCRLHQCFPDIKALYLFSNWITPVHFPKRFNTAFFLAIIDREREVIADGTETDLVEWRLAKDLAEESDAFLAPPQIYELTKLKKFHDLIKLEQFIRDVDSNGCQQFIPVPVRTMDSEVYLLPGDGRYKELFDENAASPKEVNCDTLSFRSDVMHRIEYRLLPNSTIQRNVLIQNVDPEYYPRSLKSIDTSTVCSL